jgi:hypothetical protein
MMMMMMMMMAAPGVPGQSSTRIDLQNKASRVHGTKLAWFQVSYRAKIQARRRNLIYLFRKTKKTWSPRNDGRVSLLPSSVTSFSRTHSNCGHPSA